MKRARHIFVLDENVLFQSHSCKTIKGDDYDYSSLELIIQILRNKHRLGLTDELKKKYLGWLEKLGKEGTNPHALRVWKLFLFDRNKHIFNENHLNDLPRNLFHDRHVIEPAYFLEGTLVTTDGKLEDRWNEWTMHDQFPLDIQPPPEAVKFLEKLDH
jgi:hypothetical protein